MKQLLVAAAAAVALAACNKAPTQATGSAAGASASAPSTVVATYQGKQITLAELDTSISKELDSMRRQALDRTIVRELVKAEAAKVGKDESTFIKDLAATFAPNPTDDEVKAFYEENKAAIGPRPFDEVKPMLLNHLRQEKEGKAMMAYFDDLKKKAGVKITLPVQRVSVAATGPAKGPQDAPVTIVEFSDFQCPYCSKARQVAEQVVTAYAGKVRLVFRDYPLPFHDKAQKAAEAGQCANEQGKFWEMHDWMFEHQDKLEPAALKEAAKSLGLDTAKFDGCLDSGKLAEVVKANAAAGQQAGVDGTPAFFVNGQLLTGLQPFERFKEVVDSELAPK